MVEEAEVQAPVEAPEIGTTPAIPEPSESTDTGESTSQPEQAAPPTDDETKTDYQPQPEQAEEEDKIESIKNAEQAAQVKHESARLIQSIFGGENPILQLKDITDFDSRRSIQRIWEFSIALDQKDPESKSFNDKAEIDSETGRYYCFTEGGGEIGPHRATLENGVTALKTIAKSEDERIPEEIKQKAKEKADILDKYLKQQLLIFHDQINQGAISSEEAWKIGQGLISEEQLKSVLSDPTMENERVQEAVKILAQEYNTTPEEIFKAFTARKDMTEEEKRKAEELRQRILKQERNHKILTLLMALFMGVGSMGQSVAEEAERQGR